MKALLVCLLVMLAACGEGHAIFNVDVLSFMQPTGRDTLGYNVPGIVATSADSFIPAQKVSLPSGFGKSSVDTMQLTAASALENRTGSGSIRVRIYFAKDSASVYTTTPYIDATGTVSGLQTVQLLPPTAISLSDSVFNTNQLWVGMRASISTNVGPSVTGRERLTTLMLRIVLQDKIL